MTPHASALVTFGLPLLAILVAVMVAVGYAQAGRARNENGATRTRALMIAPAALFGHVVLTRRLLR